MSFLAPLALAFGAVAAVAVVALHLLTTRRPPPLLLPTARFVPVSEARAVARAARPTDLLLLLLRVLAVLLVAAAFARPVSDAVGPRVRTVVLLDVSASVADRTTAAARARALAGVGGAVIAFDTAAREWPLDSVASLAAAATSRTAGGPARGALSPAFVAARTAAARIARGADSLRLVLLSPVAEGAVDAATPALRAGWPGRVEVERLAAAPDTARGPRVQLVTSLDDDPLAPALDRLPAARGAHPVRIVRALATASDSAWTREPGRVLVVWPARFTQPVAAEGVSALGATPAPLVAPLARLPLPEAGAGTVLARWSDASPAAIQVTEGAGCIRMVGVGLPLAGDLTLRAPFTHFVEALVAPCAGIRGAAMPDSSVAWIAGTGPLAGARDLAADAAHDATTLPAWLLAVSLALLAVELLVRRRSTP